jgi:hypothetical protein
MLGMESDAAPPPRPPPPPLLLPLFRNGFDAEVPAAGAAPLAERSDIGETVGSWKRTTGLTACGCFAGRAAAVNATRLVLRRGGGSSGEASRRGDTRVVVDEGADAATTATRRFVTANTGAAPLREDVDDAAAASPLLAAAGGGGAANAASPPMMRSSMRCNSTACCSRSACAAPTTAAATPPRLTPRYTYEAYTHTVQRAPTRTMCCTEERLAHGADDCANLSQAHGGCSSRGEVAHVVVRPR